MKRHRRKPRIYQWRLLSCPTTFERSHKLKQSTYNFYSFSNHNKYDYKENTVVVKGWVGYKSHTMSCPHVDACKNFFFKFRETWIFCSVYLQPFQTTEQGNLQPMQQWTSQSEDLQSGKCSQKKEMYKGRATVCQFKEGSVCQLDIMQRHLVKFLKNFFWPLASYVPNQKNFVTFEYLSVFDNFQCSTRKEISVLRLLKDLIKTQIN